MYMDHITDLDFTAGGKAAVFALYRNRGAENNPLPYRAQSYIHK